jgi:hypothetical protein
LVAIPWLIREIGQKERGVDLQEVELTLLYPHLANCPRLVSGQSARSPATVCSSRVLASLCFNPSSQVFLVEGGLPNCPPGVAGLSGRVGLSAGRVRTIHISRCSTGCSGSVCGPSAMTLRTICLAPVDYPPGHLRPSAPGTADCLSPLLLDLRFCVALIWVLFLG